MNARWPNHSEVVRRTWATRRRNAFLAYVAEREDAKRDARKANRAARAQRLATEQARAMGGLG